MPRFQQLTPEETEQSRRLSERLGNRIETARHYWQQTEPGLFKCERCGVETIDRLDVEACRPASQK